MKPLKKIKVQRDNDDQFYCPVHDKDKKCNSITTTPGGMLSHIFNMHDKIRADQIEVVDEEPIQEYVQAGVTFVKADDTGKAWELDVDYGAEPAQPGEYQQEGEKTIGRPRTTVGPPCPKCKSTRTWLKREYKKKDGTIKKSYQCGDCSVWWSTEDGQITTNLEDKMDPNTAEKLLCPKCGSTAVHHKRPNPDPEQTVYHCACGHKFRKCEAKTQIQEPQEPQDDEETMEPTTEAPDILGEILNVCKSNVKDQYKLWTIERLIREKQNGQTTTPKTTT